MVSLRDEIISSFKRNISDSALSSKEDKDNTEDYDVEEGSEPLPSSIGYMITADRITYTWHEMNVLTAAVEQKRWRCWGLPRREEGPSLRKHILKKVSGAAYPGELLAIMGASGAGKTTLLNTLMFRSPSSLVVSGRCAMNGIPVSSSALTSLSAYVQQDDLFIGTLTVREHLIFHALLRMDRGTPYKQRMRRVEEVISELGLTKCQDTKIGIPGRMKGISGGEKKRLAFASEVLTNPPLMFCDEPTSGLDSVMAQNVVTIMKNMALKGKTVVSTIHQPSSQVFAMFDKVMLMAEGRVAFLGTSREAIYFFQRLGSPCPSNYNPADFFIEMLAVVPTKEQSCRDAIDDICNTFDTSKAGIRLSEETEVLPEIKTDMVETGSDTSKSDLTQFGEDRRSSYKASWVAQFRAVFWRSWLSVIKNPALFQVRFLITLANALVVGLIYFGQMINQDGVMNINGAIFILITNLSLQHVLAVINVFCSELPVFLREHYNGTYRVDIYFICKLLAEAPTFVIVPVLYSSVVYYMIGLNPEIDRFFIAMGVLILVVNVSTSFGYMVSCMAGEVSLALSIGPPFLIPLVLVGGYFFNNGSVPVYLKWLSYISWFKYSNEVLLINQWKDVEYIDCPNFNSTCPMNGHVILEIFSFSESNFILDIVCLVVLMVGFQFIGFIALLTRTYRSK